MEFRQRTTFRAAQHRHPMRIALGLGLWACIMLGLGTWFEKGASADAGASAGGTFGIFAAIALCLGVLALVVIALHNRSRCAVDAVMPVALDGDVPVAVPHQPVAAALRRVSAALVVGGYASLIGFAVGSLVA